jgi:hypothetical protein
VTDDHQTLYGVFVDYLLQLRGPKSGRQTLFFATLHIQVFRRDFRGLRGARQRTSQN